MRKICLLMAVIALSCQVAYAEKLEGLEAGLARCSEIKEGIKRLECFDSLVKSQTITAKESKEETKNQWNIYVDTSKIDDSQKIHISTQSIEPIVGRYSREQLYPTLWLRCQENRTDLFVVWDMFLGTNSISVTERIDAEKAKNSRWAISTDNKAIFKNNAIAFIKSLFGHDKLLLQLTPYGENTRIVEFSITGLEDIIEPLQKACHWK